ncbi:unnamed protein product [Acanthoscelides obtectus]|uniref:Uncharacterized protein n=1 Tax=Acanthoscelides obtectus TaxID=200917 RepID=A0A9P0LPT7_ACAOB|nr:unnamed protein product [Acanthoscelides obtectus]CAK1675068.1 hypothetical protein AOBTE_LOCUS29880 [Acanthoscelides obtectus]
MQANVFYRHNNVSPGRFLRLTSDFRSQCLAYDSVRYIPIKFHFIYNFIMSMVSSRTKRILAALSQND